MTSPSSPGLSPLRGQVWVCALPKPLGPHPVVVLTVNRVAAALSAVTVAVITGTPGPGETHVGVGPESGLKKYAESYVYCSDLHTVRKTQLRRSLGWLARVEMEAIEARVRVILGVG